MRRIPVGTAFLSVPPQRDIPCWTDVRGNRRRAWKEPGGDVPGYYSLGGSRRHHRYSLALRRRYGAYTPSSFDDDRFRFSPDGVLRTAGGGKSSSAVLRVLSEVSRGVLKEKKLVSMEEAIRKCTGMPASRFRMFDRGVIREGMRADLVVFDPETIKDNAEYRHTRQVSTGIEMVLKNGRIVARDGLLAGPPLGKSVRL